MMNSRLTALILSAALAKYSSGASLPRGSLRRLEVQSNSTVLCHVFESMGMIGDDDELVNHQCLVERDDGMHNMYSIVLNDDFGETYGIDLSEAPMVSISDVVIEANEISLTSRSIVTYEGPSRHRKLSAPLTGTSKALGVRLVTASGKQPSDTLEQMSGRMMGAGGNYQEANTFLTQFQKCSFGQKTIVPATRSDGNGIANGVVQVQLNFEMSGCNILGQCQQDIINRIASSLGRSNLDHLDMVLICVPPGSTYSGNTNWAAFAYYSKNVVFLQSPYCGCISTQQHEVGHVHGFGHSNENGQIRQDKTGALGSAIQQIGGPLVCFNAHKYHLSGWMADTEAFVSLRRSAYTVRLVAFVDKKHNNFKSSDKTLLQIEGDVYCHYNKAKSFNVGTREYGNTVVCAQTSATQFRESDWRAAVTTDSSNPYYKGKTATLKGNIMIDVCSMAMEGTMDYAYVSVYDTSKGQRSSCGTNSAPAPSPSLRNIGNDLPTSDSRMPLGLCQGDCDRDSDCANNLKCFQRSGTTPVPGCAGSGGTNWDYCYDPNSS